MRATILDRHVQAWLALFLMGISIVLHVSMVTVIKDLVLASATQAMVDWIAPNALVLITE
jgi:hypothetical protein